MPPLKIARPTLAPTVSPRGANCLRISAPLVPDVWAQVWSILGEYRTRVVSGAPRGVVRVPVDRRSEIIERIRGISP